MKKALKAKSIGDKLYNIERIHSKLISFSKKTDTEKVKEIISEIYNLLLCFGENLKTKNYSIYLQSISQTISLIENKKEYSESLNYMHGCFVKYRRDIKKILKKGCEIEYQNVCLPLYLLETEIKEKKNLHIT